MKKMIILMLFTITTFTSSLAYETKDTLKTSVLAGKIVRVKDGDTVVLLDSLNKMITIRLAGVDAPEKKQPYGKNAKQFVSDQVFSKQVIVKVINKDRYGRTVGWLFYGTKDLSEELLKNGLAWHYIDYDKSPILELLEKYAREDSIGLWSLPNPIRPSEYRKSIKK